MASLGENLATPDNTTGETVEPLEGKKNTLTSFPPTQGVDSTGSEFKVDEIKGYVNEQPLDPLQKAQKNYFAQKAGLFKVLKFGASFFIAGLIAGLSLLVSIYLNKISSISVPIGQLQAQVQDIKDSEKDLNATVKNLNDQIVQLQIQQAKGTGQK